MLLFCILFLIVCENVFSFYIPGGNHTEIILTNFSFGSCFGGFLSDSEKQWIFRTIEKQNPQIWIWAGDAAYLDSFSINYFKRSINLNFTHAEKMFNKTKFNEYYQILHKRIPTIGVWDDHDFGFNDGNKYYLDKEYIKKLYLDFIDESNDSIRRSLKRGIFTSYSFGDPTTHKTVKIILLDVRYDKNSLVFDNSPDMLGIVALYLGEEQWVWLENELMTNETFTFIVSGTQILPFNRLVTESWYGNSRKRLFSLIEKTQKNGVILLSGDIHSGQFLKTPCVLKGIYHISNKKLVIL